MNIGKWTEGEKGYWLHESGIYGIYLDPPYLSHNWIAEIERHSDEVLFGRIFDVSTEKEGRQKLKIILNELISIKDIEELIDRWKGRK